SRHILQLTHSAATSRTSSGVAAAGSARTRARFALARGVAASVPVARNTGHMRRGAVAGRQAPHPEHLLASCGGWVSFHTRRGSRLGGGVVRWWGGAFGAPGNAVTELDEFASFTTSPPHHLATPRRGHASRLGSGPTILPGLRRFFGSKMRFSSR